MPFYLVTQTSLVEADDVQAAAQKAVDNIRAGGRLTVGVKSDERTVTHVAVAAAIATQIEVARIPPVFDEVMQPVSEDVALSSDTSQPSLLGRIIRNARLLVTGRG